MEFKLTLYIKSNVGKPNFIVQNANQMLYT